MPNVFISHRGADTAEATRLAEALRDAGHKVWLDDWEINVGDSIVQKMNEGLEGAAYVVMCYSASGVLSPWMGREWQSALARQLNGHPVNVLPVYLTGKTGPAIMADMKAADLMRDWDKGLAELLCAIK